MSWYYTREPGHDGQVLTDEGVPPGLSITDLVQEGPLPMSVALEIIAYMADILTIAEEDRAVHGDISPGDVYLDTSGAVSLSNYGPRRSRGRAPEGAPLFPASEVYGLGIVLHALLSRHPLGAIPRERDAHDDAIVDKLLAIDWSDLHRLPGRDSLIHFLCSMLAHSPTERPDPLDVANVLSEAGSKIGGASTVSWSARRWSSSEAQEELPTVAEVLEAPAELGRVFNKTGQYSRRQSASAKGECTAFWSRDKISAMLDDGEDPLAGSQMFQRRDLQKMLDPDEDTVDSAQPPPPPPPVNPWVPDSTISGRPSDPDLVRAMADLKAQVESSRPPPRAGGSPEQEPAVPPPAPPAPPAAPVSAAPSPVVAVSPVPKVSEPPPVRSVQKPFPWLPVVIGAVGFGLVLGMLALAAAIYHSTQQKPVVPPPPAVDAEPQVDEVEKPAQEEPAPARRSAPTPSSRVTPKSTSSSSTTARSSSVRSAKRAKARRAPPPPPPASGEFMVTFRTGGAETELVCGDGQVGRFVGVTRQKFSDITTCRVTIDGKMGAIQVKRESTISCSPRDSAVVCTGG